MAGSLVVDGGAGDPAAVDDERVAVGGAPGEDHVDAVVEAAPVASSTVSESPEVQPSSAGAHSSHSSVKSARRR